MWFVWPYTMRNRDANSASEQTVRMQDRRPTQIVHAEPQTEIKNLTPRGSHNNISLGTQSPVSPMSVRRRPQYFIKNLDVWEYKSVKYS